MLCFRCLLFSFLEHTKWNDFSLTDCCLSSCLSSVCIYCEQQRWRKKVVGKDKLLQVVYMWFFDSTTWELINFTVDLIWQNDGWTSDFSVTSKSVKDRKYLVNSSLLVSSDYQLCMAFVEFGCVTMQKPYSHLVLCWLYQSKPFVKRAWNTSESCHKAENMTSYCWVSAYLPP